MFIHPNYTRETNTNIFWYNIGNMDGMKRYSIVPSSSKRKSTISYRDDELNLYKVELEKLEQETTLILQEIDKNISKSTSIINDKLIPVIKQYSTESKKIWVNTGFWKQFFEQSANVEISTYEEPISSENLHPGNLLLKDDANDDAEAQDTSNLPAHDNTVTDSDKLGQLPNFKKPGAKPHIEESTPTWSIQQSTAKQFHSSTPQLNKGPTLLPGFHRHDSKYDSNDSIGMQPPPTLTTNITQSTTKSPVKIQTIRQSLDAYHRVSMSPKKAKLSDHNNRRSSIIENLLNSSPTLPEPPVLRSELAQQSSDVYEQEEVGRLSPVILPPELSPEKNTLLTKDFGIKRFPSTPKFAGRISDGSAAMKTPLGIKFGGDDSDLAPPQLENDPNRNTNRQEEDEDDVPLPDLETVDLTKGAYKRQANDQDDDTHKRSRIEANEEDNVFLDTTNKSVGSTIYHSILHQEKEKEREKEHGKENTTEEVQNQSKSLSHIVDEATNNSNPTANSERKNLPEPNNIFTELTNQENSQHDTSESFTSDMGSILGERYKNLFGKK
jgi:DASH complex subunit ASK1